MIVPHVNRRGARRPLEVTHGDPQPEVRRCIFSPVASLASQVVEFVLHVTYGQDLYLLRDGEKHQLTRATMLNLMLLVMSVSQLVTGASAFPVSRLLHLISVCLALYFIRVGQQICSWRANRRRISNRTKWKHLEAHRCWIMGLAVAYLFAIVLLESIRILS